MSRHSYGATRDEWRARLDRFARAGLPVVRFCAREGVSTASFYLWRKRLAPHGFHRQAAGRGPSFQAVTVVPAVPGVSVHLPGGARIEVHGVDLDVVRAVVAEVARANHGPQGDGVSC
jgi:hypothetical protein